MENRYQKWVTVSYLAVAVLVGYIAFTGALNLAAAWDLETRIRVTNLDLIIRGISVLVAGIIFVLLYRHEKANVFMNEVMMELSRVSWPTQKETSSATMVVVIMVMISGMVLGFLDYLWTELLRLVV